jgi:hypothetical protein
MSQPPRSDHRALAQALHGARAPRELTRELTREGRVELIGEAARVLIETRTKAGLFAGGALLTWLERGGDLARDYFKVTKPKSHRTARAIWRELQAHPDESQEAEGGEE